MIALVGLTVFLLLPVSPDVIGIDKDFENNNMDTPLLERRSDVKEKAVGFLRRGEFLV
jgi:MFS transporter, OPA family, solute carrier family 37 (glycerol-3-phosphate transporter), member 1/2